jgi:hypothetical protein
LEVSPGHTFPCSSSRRSQTVRIRLQNAISWLG